MNATRRDLLPTGFRLFLLIEGIAMLVLVGILLAVGDDVSPVAMGVIFATILAIQVALLFMHAYIAIRRDSLRLGFWPIFRRTIPFREVASVDVVKVDSMRDYGGWGVKGRSRSERGMLFSGGGHHGVMITTRDGRRYVATSAEPVDDLVEMLRGLVG